MLTQAAIASPSPTVTIAKPSLDITSTSNSAATTEDEETPSQRRPIALPPKKRPRPSSPFASSGYRKRKRTRRGSQESREPQQPQVAHHHPTDDKKTEKAKLGGKPDMMPRTDSVPALVNQPLFLKDEFEPDEVGSDCLGKGKRKRFQNVRMLPIEELVEARAQDRRDILDLRRKVMSIRRKKKTDMSIDDELKLIKNT